MPPSLEKRERLAAILAKENEKTAFANKVKVEREPAKMRNLVLSTNDAAMYVSGNKPAKKVTSGYTQTAASVQITVPNLKQYTTSTASVQSTSEAALRDWAVLSNFEAEVFKAEQINAKKEHRAQKQAQKEFLDQQREEEQARKMAQLEEARQVAQQVMADVAQYKAHEAAKTEARRAHEQRIKADQEAQLAQLEADRAAAAAKKRAEEDAEVAEIRRLLEEEKREKARKLAAQKQQMMEAMKENEARLRMKEEEKIKEAAYERKLEEEYDAILEAQEIAREEALKALYAKAAGKAEAAGKVVGEEMERKEREENERLRLFHLEREKALDAKDVKDAARRRKLTQQQVEMLEKQKALQRQAAQQKKVELAHYYDVVRAKDEESNKAEAEKQANIRARNVAHRKDLEVQIAAKSAAKLHAHGDVMNAQEKLLNAPLLAQAKMIL